ncbi:hypothetical protein ABNQ38_06555 (plasmid) [Azospirillum sp. A29]|uniref:hypothetical protein n=1 Tax=Azospirillum sp. A29 TaxID=3160606 RepID=UPI00366C03EB
MPNRSSPPSLVPQIDYAHHPGFVDIAVCPGDPAMSALVEDAERSVAAALREVKHPNARLEPLFERMIRLPVERLFHAVADGAQEVPESGKAMESLAQMSLKRLWADFHHARRSGGYRFLDMTLREEAMYSELRTKGYVCGRLEEDDLTALQGGLQQARAQVRARQAEGGLRREDLSCNDVGPEFHALFAEILRRSGMVRAASNALCQNLDYWGFTMELSVPQSHWWKGRYGDLRCESNHTAYYHGDEGSDLIKVIIYLSDVSDRNGPFSFLPGSWRVAPPHLQFAVSRVVDALYMPMGYSDIGGHPHTLASREGRKHFAVLPPELRHVSHWGNDVVPGSGLEQAVMKDESRMTGSAGRFILFDGARLFHRGGLVESGERWACQVILRPV